MDFVNIFLNILRPFCKGFGNEGLASGLDFTRSLSVGLINQILSFYDQMRQIIGPPVLALVVSMGGGWKSAPWLLADLRP
jgi:hypothetical protein